MASEPTAVPQARDARFRLPYAPSVASVAAAVAVSVVYLAGVKVGSALTAPGQPISTLWPPNALLMAALLVAPRRLWPLFLGILLPVHVLFQTQLGVPLATSLGWFVGNTCEALLGAALLRRTGAGEEPVFGTVWSGIRFVLYGALLAPLVTSFWDAAIVVLTGFGKDYWSLFFTRLLSNVIAILLFVPPVVMAFEGGVRRLLRSSTRRRLEAAALAAATILACLAADAAPAGPYTLVLEVCAPLFCLLWAAWRFGPFEASLAILTVTLLEIWSSILGRGPFSFASAAQNVLSLQAYAATITIPLLLFALSAQERRMADRKLRRNEERLSLSLGVSRLANWEFDLKTGEVTLSENRVGFMPKTLDPSIPQLFGVVHPDDREEVLRRHEDAVRRRDSYEVECRVFDEAGGLHWVHRRGQVVCRSGEPVKVLGVTQDITERKKNLEALAEAERVAVLARNAARMVIWTVNLETAEIYTEPGLPSLLGVESGGGGRSLDFWIRRIYEPDRAVIASLKEYVLRSFVEGQGEIQIPELEYRMYHADGSLRWFLTRATVERNPNGSPRRIVGTAMDVTKRKTAELEAEEHRRELTRLARVSALGEISATLAHELAQPLTSILSNAQAARLLLDRESPELAEIGQILDDIASEDRRAGEVIRQLRTLLRKGTPLVQEVHINPVVEEILALMRSDLITRNVTVSMFLQEGIPPVRANPVELQQVLLNLILNGCDAMEKNSRKDRNVTITTRRESSGVVVAVSDAGSGIPADCMSSLFKPFFTTKSHGIGIGLSICQSIITAVGGRIWAENNPDRGATFRFVLPPVDEDRTSSLGSI